MAILNFNYYIPEYDKEYSDGNIENELLEFVKFPDYDWFTDGRWPVVYHLSHLRQNILNWYPFKQGCSILEIGSGCGALTGLLCSRATSVKAIELTRRRAEVNFERHKSYSNLEIVVGDFFQISFKEKFDYVIVNGVLEYAAYMKNSKEPYVEFLQKAASHLKDDGKLLLAIENRLGLKYFSGSREDHTGDFFSGLNGYSAGEKVRTFSKKELTDLLLKSGLYPLKFFYPYPDYKFPSEIFTDGSINTRKPTTINYPLDMSRVKLFSEDKVYESLMKQGVMDVFANSFLVEISCNPDISSTDISYVKINANRHKEFRIYTCINDSDLKVIKKALEPEAENHINNMLKYSNYSFGRIRNFPYKSKTENGLIYEFIHEHSLESVLTKALDVGDMDSCVRILSDFRDALYNTKFPEEMSLNDGFVGIFGEFKPSIPLRWIQDANIDLVIGNIFMVGTEYWIIDYEWHLPTKAPLEFVMWRLIRQFKDNYQVEWLTTHRLCEFLEIDIETVQIFQEWERHFIHSYVGAVDLSILSKNSMNLDISSIESRILRENTVYSTLFFDKGHGFSGNFYERQLANLKDGLFTVVFTSHDLKTSKLLRWDPLEGEACKVKIQNIETDGLLIKTTPINADESTEDGEHIFYTFDPQYLLEGDFADSTYVKITYSCMIIDWRTGYRKREEEIALLQNELAKKDDELKQLNQLLVQKDQSRQKALSELKDAHIELEVTKTERDWLQSELGKLRDDLEAVVADRDKLQLELEAAKDDYNRLNLQDMQSKLEISEADRNRLLLELKRTQETLESIYLYLKTKRLKSVYEILVHGELSEGRRNE